MPLRGDFLTRNVSYRGHADLTVDQFQLLNGDADIHLVHEGYTFDDRWKKKYYAAVMKPSN